MKLKAVLLALITASSAAAFAEDAPPPPPEEEKPAFTGNVQLGFLYKSGNTHSADLLSGVDIKYDKDRWLSVLDVDLLIKRSTIPDKDTGVESFTTSDQKFTINSQTNYTLNSEKKNYVYGNVWYEQDRFNGFEHQSSASICWGRHWYETENSSLYADIGPGYKIDEVKAVVDDNGVVVEEAYTAENFIVQTQATYIRKLSDYVEFQQVVNAKIAVKKGENSIFKAQTDIVSTLVSSLQLKFSLVFDYNTEVADGIENLDSQTQVSLLYNF
ncbi:DUF481 domain-containing protein [Thalassotalea agarivorans]|uniref:DUF481 domain-containing protein n=1 Tax=Thalassotalea agarivorans TaxID=349064 RepID=UPI0025735194|nr:DUF481 domain-containing protein [Thalassotalea agarivorans]